MDRNRDVAKIKKVIHKGLKPLIPEVYIEQRSTTGHLEVFIISEGFEQMEFWDRDTLVWNVLEKALITDPVYRTIAGIFPYTPAEFAESFDPIKKGKIVEHSPISVKIKNQEDKMQDTRCEIRVNPES